jgi:CRISPR system Cascade subunit CasE
MVISMTNAISRVAVDFDVLGALELAQGLHSLPRAVNDDEGAIIGYTLSAAFGGHYTIRPWRKTRTVDTSITVVGNGDADALRSALDCASPDAQAVIRDVRSIPAIEIVQGQSYYFETRVCPVALDLTQDPTGKKRVDTYLKACDHARRNGQPRPLRDDVYRDWIANKLQGAHLLGVKQTGFGISTVFRCTRAIGKADRWSSFQIPDATMRGQITVSDADAFAQVARQGIGRQKAFGFGGLWLQAA